MNWIMQRAAEPSTWRGLGWVLVACGLLPVGSVDLVVSVGLGVVGLVDVVRKERG